MLKRETFPIAQIYVPVKRRGTVNPELVRQIAESILDIGQQTPILVRSDGDRYVLVEGLHRLEACKALGGETIVGFVVSAHVSAEKVKSPYETDADAVRQKIDRLRQLRLAKEAVEQTTPTPENEVEKTSSARAEEPSRRKTVSRRAKTRSLVDYCDGRSTCLNSQKSLCCPRC